MGAIENDIVDKEAGEQRKTSSFSRSFSLGEEGGGCFEPA
jgi:hypothetical protein